MGAHKRERERERERKKQKQEEEEEEQREQEEFANLDINYSLIRRLFESLWKPSWTGRVGPLALARLSLACSHSSRTDTSLVPK